MDVDTLRAAHRSTPRVGRGDVEGGTWREECGGRDVEGGMWREGCGGRDEWCVMDKG